MAETTRISVALTPEDHREVLKLARRCNTSASALGQLAIRHMLLRERGGTIPMLPEAQAAPERPHSERLAERAAGGIAFWRDSEAEAPALPDTPRLFGNIDLGRAEVFTPVAPQPEPAAKVRVSVGLTEDEATRISALARRCNISTAALGELAYRHILLQAANGAIPMLPAPVADMEPENNLERSRMGRMVSHTAWREDAIAEIQHCNAAIEELDRQEKRRRLTVVSDQAPTIFPEAG